MSSPKPKPPRSCPKQDLTISKTHLLAWPYCPRVSDVSVIHCCVPGLSNAGTERAGRPAPIYKYCRETQRHWIEETKKLHDSDKQWITSPSLPINTCIVFLPLNLIIVDVIVLVTNTLNLFWWGLLKLDVQWINKYAIHRNSQMH